MQYYCCVKFNKEMYAAISRLLSKEFQSCATPLTDKISFCQQTDIGVLSCQYRSEVNPSPRRPWRICLDDVRRSRPPTSSAPPDARRSLVSLGRFRNRLPGREPDEGRPDRWIGISPDQDVASCS